VCQPISGRENPSKKEVKKTIKERTEKYSLDADWYAKNDDSSFYKSDTIKLVKHQNYEYHADSNCCFMVLRFRGTQLDMAENRMCFEPPVTVAYGDGRGHFQYSLKENNGELIFSFENKFRKQKFRIISLQTIELWQHGDKAQELTLVRQNN
jgi:hypothetical protein